MALSTSSFKGKDDAAVAKAEEKVAAATAADVKAEEKAAPKDDAEKAAAEPDPRLDNRTEAERLNQYSWGGVVPQHVNGPDLAGQAEFTKKYLAGLASKDDA